MKKELTFLTGGIGTAVLLFFATPFFPFDELAVLAATIFYGISRLFK